MLFKGSAVAIVTPFTEDGKVNFNKFGELLEFQIANGTDAVVVCGTTGEATTMTTEEQLDLVKYAVEKVNKRIPVIAGTGSNNTMHSVFMSQECEKLGVDGLLVITPYYNKANKAGLKRHFETIAASVKLPIILYNVPGRTCVNISPSLVAELAKIDNIVAVKEASGDLGQVAEIASLVPEDFAIYSGNDDTIVPLLSVGGHGVISVLANICPRETHDMVTKFTEGDVQGAKELQLKLDALIASLFIEVNPVPVKTALNLIGYEVGDFRLPLAEMEDKNLDVLRQELVNAGFKVVK
ncbi:4-hydroxy-tetrahydrodipicolinate synthase [Metaclostridioides mangenotii]|uniref:4-hydroxy-tetrahydrodipicolinate synthase n=1 Tax=Metaclostridioides mangenotii TaxID=1540 RepID=A0ABS4EAP2_9FIRM|nr:4-hydroxy-tetrahydrodipicolinate synthase [Clostridioides mangenotii]MBP1855014.1 4-hydroxy-tetrahydrodipicolinate synthase [Clostridioides mangenotii]